MTPFRQRGATLVEALLACIVVAFGALGAAQLQGELRRHADLTRQRAEAVRLASGEAERLRAWAVVAPPASAPGAASYDGVAAATRDVDAASGFVSSAAFRIETAVDAMAGAPAKAVRIVVTWADSRGTGERVELASLVAGIDPAYAGSLALGAGAGRVPGAFARPRSVPVDALDLGDGTSLWKPAAAASIALRFSHAADGAVVARCSGIAAATPTVGLAPSDLGACSRVAAATTIVGGTIRFSDASPPDPERARDLPAAVGVALVLTRAGHRGAPECWTEAKTTASDRHVAWHCLVVPRDDGRWSGRADLVADGWSIGGAPGQRKVCRYATDRDASGAVDANDEHPREWSDVAGPLMHQNFLVVRGDEACPSGHDVAADHRTEPHQP